MQPIVVIGAGGFAREVADVIHAINAVNPTYTFLGYVDDDAQRWDTILNDFPILGGFAWAEAHSEVMLVCGIGNPRTRKKVVERYTALGGSFATLIHPQAVTTRYIRYGAGTVVTAGAVLTNNIHIGTHVHINLTTTIGHDSVIGDYCTLNPGVHISGNVTLGEGCEIGTGAAIIQGRSIGAWTTVGAGAVVVRDLPANVTAVGVPARVK